MLISSSILAVGKEFLKYAEQLKQARVDYIHLDLLQSDDGPIKLKDIQIFNSSTLPLDVHLIYESIDESVINILNNSTAQILSIQFENLLNPNTTMEIISGFKGNVGFALTPGTNLSVIDPYIDKLNHILVMCSEPGISGAKFDQRSFKVIDYLRERYPSLKLYADGGIEMSISKTMSRYGVSLIVLGSYLSQRSTKLDSTIFSLKYSGEKSIPVTRNMIKRDFLPIVDCDDDFITVMDTINRWRLGICFVINGMQLISIITDGDIRRALLKFQRDIFDVTARTLSNTDFYYATENQTLDEIYFEIAKLKKPIYVIPVVSKKDFIGALSLY